MKNPLSPAACLELLELHSERRLTLPLAEFEEFFDKVLLVLEAANNERFRAIADEEK